MAAIRDFLKVYWPLAFLALVGMIIALRFVDPAPPGRITMAGGSPGGAYAAYAQRYAALLAEHGVDVEVIETAGSLENLRLLIQGDVDVALLQGGVARPSDGEHIRSLGGLFFEPFWVFARETVGAEDFEDLRDVRTAIGAPGSGTRVLAEHLRREFGGSWGDDSALELSGQAAAAALLDGEIDAAVFAAGISAPYVETLLRAPGIDLIPFERAAALARREPALAEIALLHGVVDIGEDLPAGDVSMIAAVAQLAVARDLHPAIHAILLEAADDTHSAPGLLAPPDAFPDGRRTDLPLSDEAERFYENGPSALRRWFPFAVANFLERAWVLLIPLVTLLIPLVRAAPPIYRWRVRRRIYVWYEDLRKLEARGRAAKSLAERDLVRQHLGQLQEEIGRLEVPLSYTDDVYRLRHHVAFVNQLLGNLDPRQKIEPVTSAPPPEHAAQEGPQA